MVLLLIKKAYENHALPRKHRYVRVVNKIPIYGRGQESRVPIGALGLHDWCVPGACY